MKPTKKLPLFIVSGASGVGKSSICKILFQNETDYIVLESDILWHEVYNTPEDDYLAYRRLQLRLCASISQAGKPVVLCGCATPGQFDSLRGRASFTEIHYLAVVCEGDILNDRLQGGRNISDESWIASSVQFNSWLKANGETNGMILLDNTCLTPEEGAVIADNWIKSRMKS